VKTRHFSKKLNLKKQTVATLRDDQMARMKGGVADPTWPYVCPSLDLSCTCQPTETACQTVCPGGPFC
jgi:hypothetical protein